MKSAILALSILAMGATAGYSQEVTRGTPTPVIETADGSLKNTVRLLTPLIALGVLAVIVSSADIPES